MRDPKFSLRVRTKLPPNMETNVKSTSSHIDDSRISFVCQRCLQPLRIDPSFYSMNEHTLAELTLPICPAAKFTPSESKADIVVPPFKLEDSTDPSSGGEFTLVDEEGDNSGTLGTKLKNTIELFDLISGKKEGI